MDPLRRAIDRTLEAMVVPSFSRLGIQTRQRLYPDWPSLDSWTMRGRTVLVTGANSGLGYAAAEQLARMGARVLLLVRSSEKGADTRARIAAATGSSDVGFWVADLADLASVRRFAEQLLADEERLDAVVHNAGAMFAQRQVTGDGIEATLQVHVVAPMLLTGLLVPLLRDSAPSRVIWVSSGGMYTQQLDVDRLESPDDYRPSTAYARAKRAQVALVQELAARLDGSGITFHAMHPGWAATPGVARSLPGFNRIMGPLLREPAQGADTIVWLVAAATPDAHSGAFWLDRRPRARHKLPATRTDATERQRLWDLVTSQAGVDPQQALRTGTAG